MIAKIGRGSNMTGAISYNWLKVVGGNAEVLFTNNIIEAPDGTYSIPQLSRSFAPYLMANKRTEKPVLHISLNPDPGDKVSDEHFRQIAEEYMNRMGYGSHPFVVFKHTDTERTHIHIVSTCVDRNGKKISDTYEKMRSMDICRDLERQYNLTPATAKQQERLQEIFRPVDYTMTDIKSQVASVVRHLPQYYQYAGMGAYNALLSLFHITAEEVTGEFRGQTKRGLVYFALDEKGTKASKPFKSSLFGKQAGLDSLEAHFATSKENLKDAPPKANVRNAVEVALSISNDESKFKKNLVNQGISTVIRRSTEGRLYGITFIDHESRTVWNGSQLGKHLSANTFNQKWPQEPNLIIAEAKNLSQSSTTTVNSLDQKSEIHKLFCFLNTEYANASESDSYIFDGIGSLLPQINGEDYEEVIFEKRLKRRKGRL